MRNLFAACLILAAVAVGCGPSREQLLVGRWNCSGSSKGFSVTGEVEYVTNGRTTQTFEVSGAESGNTIEFSSIAHGTWSIEGDQLVETVDKFTVVEWAVNDQRLPASSFPSEISEAFVGAASGSDIERLTQNMLITRVGSDHVSCSR